MCRGRHRVENRVGEVQARGGRGRGGAGWGWAGWLLTSPIAPCFATNLLLSPGKFLCVCPVTIFTAVLFKLHVLMESAQDDLRTLKICSVKRSRRVRVRIVSKASEQIFKGSLGKNNFPCPVFPESHGVHTRSCQKRPGFCPTFRPPCFYGDSDALPAL